MLFNLLVRVCVRKVWRKLFRSANAILVCICIKITISSFHWFCPAPQRSLNVLHSLNHKNTELKNDNETHTETNCKITPAIFLTWYSHNVSIETLRSDVCMSVTCSIHMLIYVSLSCCLGSCVTFLLKIVLGLLMYWFFYYAFRFAFVHSLLATGIGRG